MPSSFRGVNHNIYSLATWEAGNPNRGWNYLRSAHGLIDYFFGKGMRFLRIMFTWEWLQPAFRSTIPQPGVFRAYWDDFNDTVGYATSLGMTVLIEHYGYSSRFFPGGGGTTTPSWKGVAAGDGVKYTNQIGGPDVTTADFADLWSQLAAHFRTNPRVCFGMCNEPHHLSTARWFGTAQAVISAIRAARATQPIFVPGNDFSSWDWDSAHTDTDVPQRSSAFGWENANGLGAPLADPSNNLVASPHIYLDDAGGGSFDILPARGGTQVNALVDRIKVVVDWARGYNAAHPGNEVRVHLSEIGFYGDDTLGRGGNYSKATAEQVWARFLKYLGANADVLLGFAWWGAADVPWWADVGTTHFSVSPTSAGPPHAGDTVNMTFLEAAGSFA
jgi:endoglucanase